MAQGVRTGGRDPNRDGLAVDVNPGISPGCGRELRRSSLLAYAAAELTAAELTAAIDRRR